MRDFRGKAAEFSDLLGKVLVSVEQIEDEEIVFTTANETYRMLHHQDCCETVTISEIIGNLSDLVNDGPVLLAEVVDSADGPEPGSCESFTWTFYKLRTQNGDVTIRWLGESNGYYSESVDFEVTV